MREGYEGDDREFERAASVQQRLWESFVQGQMDSDTCTEQVLNSLLSLSALLFYIFSD